MGNRLRSRHVSDGDELRHRDLAQRADLGIFHFPAKVEDDHEQDVKVFVNIIQEYPKCQEAGQDQVRFSTSAYYMRKETYNAVKTAINEDEIGTQMPK